MARLTGPDEACRLVYRRDGRIRAAGYKATLYLDQACTTPADILTVDGEPIPGSIVTVDDYSRLPLVQYPDDVRVLYTRVAGGPVVALYAGTDGRLTPLEATVTGLGGVDARLDSVELTVAALAETATRPVGTTTGTVAAGDDTRITGAAQKSADLSDLANTATARTNLGLGNVNNTSDAAKPVSTAQQTALDAKVDRARQPVNVKDHGAVGDGTADDTTALASAMSAAASSNRELHLPPGTYLFTALTVTTPIRGAGLGRTTLRGPTITMSTPGTYLADLKVLSSSTIAVSSAHAPRLRLTNVEIDHLAGVTDHLAWNAFNIDQLVMTGCRLNIGGVQLSGCDDFLIQGNFWDCQYLNTNEPLHISAQSSGVVNANTITRTTTDAIDLYSSGHRCVITNNRFIGLRGNCGLECKVTLSDDSGNTSSPGNILDATIIANNVFKDLQGDVTSTKAGIFAVLVDNRAVKTWDVTNTNRAVSISGNILEDFSPTDPGNGAIVSWQGIAFTGHNGAIRGNIIKNMRAWNGAVNEGISLSGIAVGVTEGWKSVGLSVQDNTIIGAENGYGIRTGNLDQCVISGNVIRGDEDNGTVTRFGIDVVAGATLNQVGMTGNLFMCNFATGMALRTAAGSLLNRCQFSNNVLLNCGVAVGATQYCTFSGNTMDNAANSTGFAVGVSGTSSRGNTFIGCHFTLSSDYGLVLTDCDGFSVTGCTFTATARAVLLNGGTRNGVLTGNVSIGQAFGTEFPHYSGVSAADQATMAVGLNRVNSGATNILTGAPTTASTVTVTGLSAAAGTTTTTTVALTGAATTDQVVVVPLATLPAGVAFSHAYVSAADTLTVTFVNATGSPISVTANLQAIVFRRFV